MQFEQCPKNGSRKNFFLLIALLCAALLLYLCFYGVTTPFAAPPAIKIPSVNSWLQPAQTWIPYSYKNFRDKSWFYKTCVTGKKLTALEELSNLLLIWKHIKKSECRKLFLMFTNILSVIDQNAEVKIPKSFEVKVKGWLGYDEKVFKEAHNQSVIFIYNEYTREQNAFNPIRNKRPMSIPEQPERDYVNALSKETAKSCDFCNYKKFTAEDKFGHIEGIFSYSSANTFKLDRWHALFMLRTHHPLNWNAEQFLDWMETAQKWYQKVYSENSVYKFPAMVWDLLPHAGASQVHPHLHGFLDSNRYQGAMENVRLAAIDYQQDHPGQDYFSDWIAIHSILGLTVEYGTAVAVASLVPKKDNEVVIISSQADTDFFKLMYFVVRAFIDDMEKLCFSAGIAFPSMTGKVGPESLPVYMRIVTRGAVADIRSDISSLELFASPNANTDPYKVIKYIKESVKKRAALSS